MPEFQGITVLRPHRCWQIPELVARIAQFCASDGFGDLCRLARTSRRLQEPALNIMWRQQCTFENLIRCLPEQFWFIEDGRDHNYGWYEERWRLTGVENMVQRDWVRFDFYATRVRLLSLGKSSSGIAFDGLRAAKGSTLLPHLQEVEVQNDSPDFCLRVLDAVVSASVTKVTIDFHHGRFPEEDLGFPAGLAAVAELSPRVQNFNLRLTLVGDSDLPSLFEPLGLWTNLRSSMYCLTTTPDKDAVNERTVDRRALWDTSLTPMLREVDIRCYKSVRGGHSLEDHSMGLVRFPGVSKLRLRAVSKNSITGAALLGQCTFPSLKSLVVTARPSAILTVLPLVPDHITGAGLEYISLGTPRHERRCGENLTPFILGFADLRPLSTYHNLRELYITVGDATCELDDDAWEALATSWPRLRHIKITDDAARCDGSPATRPSCEALAHLARHCRKLKTIIMTLQDPPGDAFELESVPVNGSVTHLDLGHLSLSDMILVGPWIARMFPRLLSFGETTRTATLGEKKDGCNLPWEELRELVKSL